MEYQCEPGGFEILDSEDSYDDPSSKPSYWIWMASPSACKKCKALDGKIFRSNEIPPRPHPNCKCKIVRHDILKCVSCETIIDYTDWEAYYTGTPKYDLLPIFAGNTGRAVWVRKVKIRESRIRLTKKKCGDSDPIIVSREHEWRSRTEVERKLSFVMRFHSGGSVDRGDWCTTNNPWTGETIVRAIK